MGTLSVDGTAASFAPVVPVKLLSPSLCSEMLLEGLRDARLIVMFGNNIRPISIWSGGGGARRGPRGGRRDLEWCDCGVEPCVEMDIYYEFNPFRETGAHVHTRPRWFHSLKAGC